MRVSKTILQSIASPHTKKRRLHQLIIDCISSKSKKKSKEEEKNTKKNY